MAYLTIVINAPNDGVPKLNAVAQNPTKVPEEINALIDYLSAISAGAKAASIQVVTRATDPGVTTDGDAASESVTYNKL